jgi:hypothetical protein
MQIVNVDSRFPLLSVGTAVALKANPSKRIGVIDRVRKDDWMVLISIEREFGNRKCALAEWLVPVAN